MICHVPALRYSTITHEQLCVRLHLRTGKSFNMLSASLLSSCTRTEHLCMYALNKVIKLFRSVCTSANANSNSHNIEYLVIDTGLIALFSRYLRIICLFLPNIGINLTRFSFNGQSNAQRITLVRPCRKPETIISEFRRINSFIYRRR